VGALLGGGCAAQDGQCVAVGQIVEGIQRARAVGGVAAAYPVHTAAGMGRGTSEEHVGDGGLGAPEAR
jgi:hypothetical protein